MNALRSFLAYLAVFAVLAFPWLRDAAHSTPCGPGVVTADQWLIVWNLAWVAHALATDPAHLLDAPINYPAPAQLTGIEHHASTQLVFAPLFWLTDNAVLAANWTAFISYPIAALAFERLLRALGLAAAPAWAAGLLFALGPDRVPGHVFVLKYPNLYLPLVALALTQLRARPGRGAAAIVFAATTLALFSPYYVAVMALVVAALWTVFELFRARDGRLRFALLAGLAVGAALSLLVLASLPWYGRPELGSIRSPSPLANRFVAIWHTASSGRFALALAAIGVVAFMTPLDGARRAAACGLVLTVVAQLLMLGPSQGDVVLPFAALAATPARFFRYPYRFVVVLGLGTALLGAAALETAWRRLGRIAGGALVAAAIVTLLWTRGPHLADTCREEFTAETHPVYAAVREAARHDGPGPLLELPLVPVLGDPGNRGTEVQAMLGSTRHWLPLVTGYLDYQPPHRGALVGAIAHLPESDALDDLVDMTHVRWILLRPESDWPAYQRGTRDGLTSLEGVELVHDDADWRLLRVDRVPRHPEWFAAIAAGRQPRRSALGTPLAPLPHDAARAVVALAEPWTETHAVQFLHLDLRIRNDGIAAWPVSIADRAPRRYTVGLVARWLPFGKPTDPPVKTEEIALRRDVPAGETLAQHVLLRTPKPPRFFNLELPRRYHLEVAVRQIDGAAFDGPGNEPLRVDVKRLPRPTPYHLPTD